MTPTGHISTGGKAAAIGMFDGVHTGHSFLLDNLKSIGTEHGLQPMAITFANHPLDIIAPEKSPQLLSTAEEKQQLITATGVDAMIIPFTEELRTLSAQWFLHLLADRYGVKHILLGYNNRFGHDAPNGIESYRMLARECGIAVTQADEFVAPGGIHVSSSAIRNLIAGQGDAATANTLLGHPYTITGIVTHGQRIGRTIGFPTANISPAGRHKLIPMAGVYATMATTPDGNLYPAIVNIGHRPTVNPVQDVSTEAHLIGFSGYLYGHTLTLQFIARLRDERRFPGVAQLRAQLEADKAAALRLL